MARMRWIVVGAGAVGGVVGGLLGNAGHDVTLVARGEHKDAIAANGLRVRTPNLDVTVRCAVSGSIGGLQIDTGDVVLLAVKSQDSETALRELSLVADPGAVIVCLQNGLENERVAARRFADVLSVPVMLPSTIVEPGVVAAWGSPYPAVLDVGRCPDAPVDELVRSVAAGFVAAGMLSTPRPDIARWKRRKLLMNVANSVQALVGLGGGQRLIELATAEAEASYDEVVRRLRQLGIRVETGRFRAHMIIDATNDGSVSTRPRLAS